LEQFRPVAPTSSADPCASLIALGLGADPAFVVTHHCARVFLVVLIALPASVWLRRAGWLGVPKADTPAL
jgi:hypothetical protein